MMTFTQFVRFCAGNGTHFAGYTGYAMALEAYEAYKSHGAR